MITTAALGYNISTLLLNSLAVTHMQRPQPLSWRFLRPPETSQQLQPPHERSKRETQTSQDALTPGDMQLLRQGHHSSSILRLASTPTCRFQVLMFCSTC